MPIELHSLEKILLGVHASLAWVTGTPEWMLDEKKSEYFQGQSESMYLASKVKAVSDHYKPDWLDQKTADWIMLLQAVGMIYGPRVMATAMKPRAPKAAKAPPQQAPPAEAQPGQFVLRPLDPTAQANGSSNPPPSSRVNIAGVGEVSFDPQDLEKAFGGGGRKH